MPGPGPPFATRLQAVLEQMLELLPDDIEKGIGSLGEHVSPPYVVLEPGRQDTASSRGGVGALYTRLERVVVHCWGKDIGQCEDLQELVLNALRQIATASIEPGGGEWNLGELTTRGVELAFDVIVQIPVMRRERVAAFLQFNPRNLEITEPNEGGD